MRKSFAVILAAFFLFHTAVPWAFAGEEVQRDSTIGGMDRELAHTAAETVTPPLDASQIVVYNNSYDPKDPCSPMVYVTGLSLRGAGFTVRVYDSSNMENRKLLGYREVEDTTRGFTAEIPVAGLDPQGGSVYVTIQENGAKESAMVCADYSAVMTPSIGIDIIKIKEEYSYEDKRFAGSWPIYTTDELKKDSYYLVDVKLRNFHTVGGVTVPIRYNTDYLELVPLSPSTKLINKNGVVSAAGGAWFNFAGKTGIYKASLQCGVLPGYHTDYGTAGGVDEYPIAKGSDAGEYPYVNTDTGLIKLEVMKNKYGAFDYRDGNWKSGVSIVRCVFRAKQDGAGLAELTDLVHFATSADYIAAGGQVSPEGRPDDSAAAAQYYATQHPSGPSVTLEDAQLLRTPPAVTQAEADFPEEGPVDLTVSDLERLPESFEEKTAQTSLPENCIKVYNYTNSQSYVSGLDAYLSDRLVLSPSAESGGVIYGDCISVYRDSALQELLGEGMADPEGAVAIDLGNKLDAGGGKVYVTNRRAGIASSAVAFTYPPEAERDVTFRIYRTALPAGVEEGADPQKNPEALKGIRQGEQLQIRIYFNDINDLMGYTFPIHFNTLAVEAADRFFRPIEQDGYMTESQFFNGRTPFSVGEDICELTTTELVIYYAQEQEIPGIMEQLGISTREEWDKRKKDIQVKIEFGASTEGTVWNGGLLFTGPRDGASGDGGDGGSGTAYPYLDNNSSSANTSNDGLIKLWATSLTSPMSRLERDGGYHFLTLNFTGVTNVNSESAAFRFADKNDAVYDGANPAGGRLVLSGPEPDAGRNVTFHWEVYSMDEIPVPSSLTVGGIIRSGKPGLETMVTLTQNGETVYTTTLGGITGGNATAEVEQPFLLEGIMPGTYTLRIHKDIHADVVINGLKVEGDAMDLTQNTDPRVRMIRLPCGDISGDGRITFLDRQLMKRSGFYGTAIASLTDEEKVMAFRMDLNGDGFIKADDLQILMAAPNYGRGTVYINMEE